MLQFLLLRNNRESGPYSATDLEKMGLKPYDLIWVNGKSAAWRYPGEIDELKAFAPAVEEQPYDRFFKKSSEGLELQSENKTKTDTISNDKQQRSYKRIVVKLPESGGKKEKVAVSNSNQQPNSESVKDANLVAQPLRVAITDPSLEAPVRLDNLFPAKKKLKIDRRSIVLASGGFAVIVLVGGGIFIGMTLQQPATRDAGKQETEKVYTIPENESITKSEPINNSNVQNIQSSNLTNERPAAISRKKSNRSDSAALAAQIAKLHSQVKTAAVDSSALPKAEEKKPVEKPMPNLMQLVDVTNNDFQVGPFGGISKLKITVTNSSDFDINSVVVEIDYIKVNKEIFKTETINIRNVDAHSSVSIDAPKSNRGNKIRYHVKQISSKGKIFRAD